DSMAFFIPSQDIVWRVPSAVTRAGDCSLLLRYANGVSIIKFSNARFYKRRRKNTEACRQRLVYRKLIARLPLNISLTHTCAASG
ncbi:MAG: hypothetical protein AABY81_06090, partial [Pseudomonadota bacterium]